MSILSDRQFIVVGLISVGIVYWIGKKAGAVVQTVNPLSDQSIFAQIPGAVYSATAQNDDSVSEWIREQWSEWQNPTPSINPGTSAPDLGGFTGPGNDIPIIIN